MRMVELIEKKRDGEKLSKSEIRFFVEGYTKGNIPDYQVSALLMAIFLQNMDEEEINHLTLSMAYSGKVLDLSDIAEVVVDKHSTGGVGDKVSIVVAPTVASCGLPVGKMSGRGLGFSGGTLDKFESIPGYRVNLSVSEFKSQLADIGIVLAGQSANLAPADGKLYALRDVTGTVPSLPLIVSSIMSKKIASGADAIVLDVKVGTGAFMRILDDAKALAEALVRVGNAVDRQVTARISDMNQPLGYAVGNILEVCEALETLHGDGPEQFYHHCITIAGEMLHIGKHAKTLDEGIKQAELAIQSGRALQKLYELVRAQGGDVKYLDLPDLFPKAPVIQTFEANREGYLSSTQADEIGLAVVDLGGGRVKKGDTIDHRVGVVMHIKIGDRMELGQPLFSVYAKDIDSCAKAVERVKGALSFTNQTVKPLPLFYN